ncbi:hypothetical protein Cgig2_009059 [Carnegiea gigantea]|uniref:Uncharacterized protein n=1 Tax=Carnegiea gigantea TaxID=171969 RepID=A0A9Q1Q6W6_9CARY|nr:hypothetical protein Cgig2_009059 [Carnegiea gigantea]
MVRFKEYKRWDKIYLSVVEHEEMKAELDNTFIVYPSLLRPEFEQIPTIPRSDFASPTHYVLDPAPVGPLIVHYSGFGGAKSFEDARRRIHERAIADLGCTMLNKNKYKTLNDDRTLGYEKLSCLIALRSHYLPLRRAATFYELPGALKLDPRTWFTSYNDALCFWTAILSKNTKSIAMLSSHSLHLNKFMTKKYQDWWSKMTISDLRANVSLLQQSAGHDPSKSKKNRRGNTSKDGSDFEDQDSKVERIGESLDTPITNRGGDTIDNDDSNQVQKLTLNVVGIKKCNTVAANTSSAALGDSFFNGITSCSDMPNLEDEPSTTDAYLRSLRPPTSIGGLGIGDMMCYIIYSEKDKMPNKELDTPSGKLDQETE